MTTITEYQGKITRNTPNKEIIYTRRADRLNSEGKKDFKFLYLRKR